MIHHPNCGLSVLCIKSAETAYGVISPSVYHVSEVVFLIIIFLIQGCCLQGTKSSVKVKSSVQKFHVGYHELVDHYGIYVSQMTM